MITKFNTLKIKLEDEDYIESLSYKRKNELKVCGTLLTDEELNRYSSIEVAYPIARQRYIQNNFDEEFRTKHSRIYLRYNIF